MTGRTLTAIFVLTAIVFAVSCSYKPRSSGADNEIVVVISFEDRRFVEPLIDSIFGRVIYTPEAERFFDIVYVTPEQFEEYKVRTNIVIAALFSVVDTTADVLVRNILPENQVEMIRRGEQNIFAKRDFLARNQVFAVLAANSDKELAKAVQIKGRWLFDQFDSGFLERQAKHMYKRMEQKELADELWQKYKWKMRIQHDYVMIKEQPQRNFIWFGRSFPYRWLSVQWVDHPVTKAVDSQIAADMIHDYPSVYYKTVNFTHYYEKIEETTFKGRKAWRAEGLWEHKKDIKGGPYVSYIFYDERTDRIYHINYLIHHPSGKKMLSLRQMDIMIRTFATDPA
ncbi:MAG: DUF4837 family protein [Candidatus Marinimicrobia bacterium]|jgi:hypothetical protein|nr:hypothetical protein [Candidatus Neomarinimicrobiota bacterium]MDP6455945.1 DUF4837 family protein [Candidatus Neomarinimicrobiota bacterium]MDP6593973.1 DUF4837 family protein [Candidatus Neomarinimicrobiota bacterium]MDP6835689.1 DUF4837 family protein [Candidatus Neomarinimicrobiota bacterium]|tara:strand:- start:4350 stop:5369 length:1020 start_codon:yes stop_codon:yes gene_type:complete